MVAVKQKRPRAPARAAAAGKLNPATSYPAAAELQAAGLRAADDLIDVAERFLSCLYHALRGGVVPPNLGTGYRLPVEAMPTACHRIVFSVLLAHQQRGVRPTLASVRHVAEALGYAPTEKTLNSANPDLIDRLELAECGPAGLHNYGRLLARAHRRRTQVTRLWRALIARINDPIGEGERSPRRGFVSDSRGPRRRFSSRAVACVFGKGAR